MNLERRRHEKDGRWVNDLNADASHQPQLHTYPSRGSIRPQDDH